MSKKDQYLGLHTVAASIIANKANKMTEKKTPVTGRTESDVKLALYEAERKRKTRNIILKSVGAAVVIIGGVKITKKIIKNQTDKNNSPEVQYAKRLRTAMSPSGVWWLPDGTNERGVMSVAFDISNDDTVRFRDVQNAYKKLYGKNLSEHLEGELNTDEYTKFLNIVSDTYNADTDKENPVYFSKGKMIVFTEKTPMFKNSSDYFSVQTLPKNSFFINATTTGKEKTMVDVITGGAIFKQKRIEIKLINGAKTMWTDAEGMITDIWSKENLLKYKNKGYRAFKLSQ
ncbi:MAG: hypothetical protein L3J56_00470 [Bacteroidales bacterium]|nr:hypothetical protein [Bacteroidales bacterium]